MRGAVLGGWISRSFMAASLSIRAYALTPGNRPARC
jgi:hypothetical protein